MQDSLALFFNINVKCLPNKVVRIRIKDINNAVIALAGMAQWTECLPANQKVAGSIPNQGNAWSVGQVPSNGHARGNRLMFFPSSL